MSAKFIRVYPPAQPMSSVVYWFPFRNDRVLMRETGHGIEPLQGDEGLIGAGLIVKRSNQDVAGSSQGVIESRFHEYEQDDLRVRSHVGERMFIGMLDGIPCVTYEAGIETLPEDIRELTLREVYGQVDEVIYSIVIYAYQMLYWQRTSNFCPVCGHIPEAEEGTWGKRCPNCGHVAYPHVTPAILALVHDDNGNMLLTHKRGWGKRFSCVAGFTEPGESLEECVQREILEELGVEVTDVSYVGSQPWPFPHQLMVGYTARYVGGDIHIQEQELDDARWFSVKEPPEMPPSMSLAHTIIQTWIEKNM